jgi:DNA repair protein RadA/Sms
MQVCKSLAENQRNPVMYVSSEQSINDIVINLPDKMRKMPNNMIGMHEPELSRIISSIREYRPTLVVIDSAQTTSLGAEYEVGSAMTIKTVIRTLVPLAKRENFAFVLIAHITKDGSVAGPRTLEYLVDSCFWISVRGQKRVFQSVKNRGVECPRSATFEMVDGEGLVEVREQEERDNEQSLGEGESISKGRGSRLRRN